MALLQMNYLSNALLRTVPVNIILPVDKVSSKTRDYEEQKRPFKTLYLLHGMFGNYTDWCANTRVQRWAEERNLAVVMPSGDNMYYVESLLLFNNYGAFIGEELPRVMRATFPLSSRREDTFIAGLSMGGFGAVRNGFKYADTFSHIAGLSSALTVLDPAAPPIAGRPSSATLRLPPRLTRASRWPMRSSRSVWPLVMPPCRGCILPVVPMTASLPARAPSATSCWATAST